MTVDRSPARPEDAPFGQNFRAELWACTHCGYTIWLYDGAEPRPGHCGSGYWVSGADALGIIPEVREYWMAP